MTDGSLEEYARAVEEHLTAGRGKEHVLSPRDFSLLRSWVAAGVPLGTILAGIDLARDSDADVSSLAYCRARVEQLAGTSARTRAVETPGAAVDPDLVPRLHELQQALLAHHARAQAGVHRPLARVQELLDLVSVSRRPNAEFVRRVVTEIDEAVSAAAMELLDPARREEIRAQAERALARQRGKVDEAALEAALARYLTQRAREELALPFLG
jgi:hypothetical protein